MQLIDITWQNNTPYKLGFLDDYAVSNSIASHQTDMQINIVVNNSISNDENIVNIRAVNDELGVRLSIAETKFCFISRHEFLIELDWKFKSKVNRFYKVGNSFWSFIKNEPNLFEFKLRPNQFYETIKYAAGNENILGFLRCVKCLHVISKRHKTQHQNEHDNIDNQRIYELHYYNFFERLQEHENFMNLLRKVMATSRFFGEKFIYFWFHM